MLARIQKSMKEKDQGFTLIELLVVIITIGILAAIAIPVFLNQRKKATESGLKSDLRTVANQVETAYTDTQAYPAAVTQAAADKSPVITSGVSVPVSDAKTRITYSTTPDAFCLMAANSKVGTGIQWVYDSDGGGLRKDTDCTP